MKLLTNEEQKQNFSLRFAFFFGVPVAFHQHWGDAADFSILIFADICGSFIVLSHPILDGWMDGRHHKRTTLWKKIISLTKAKQRFCCFRMSFVLCCTRLDPALCNTPTWSAFLCREKKKNSLLLTLMRKYLTWIIWVWKSVWAPLFFPLLLFFKFSLLDVRTGRLTQSLHPSLRRFPLIPSQNRWAQISPGSASSSGWSVCTFAMFNAVYAHIYCNTCCVPGHLLRRTHTCYTYSKQHK